jgi:hypothetical protein
MAVWPNKLLWIITKVGDGAEHSEIIARRKIKRDRGGSDMSPFHQPLVAVGPVADPAAIDEEPAAGSMPADRLHSSANDLICFGRYK